MSIGTALNVNTTDQPYEQPDGPESGGVFPAPRPCRRRRAWRPREFRPRGGFHRKGMSGCGAHNQPPGAWSDDTPLALRLASSLSRGFSPADIARNFAKRPCRAFPWLTRDSRRPA
ncbi:MAG: ADP-ribosylglycohydrolase family protein [Treponema sp.]|nr:ADP-ribosylglycohydrolase family protein [Treponema sp.]